MPSNKETILNLYFLEKLRLVDIAETLGISKSAVSQVLSKDKRYIKEKENRKLENRNKNIEFTKKYMKSKRKKKGTQNDYDVLRQMHEQASRELSGGRKPISNRAFRDWNTSIYKYNERSKSYILKRGINVGADVPKKIKWQ